MSRPVGYKNQTACQNCKFVYRSDWNCYCIYDGYPVPSDTVSIDVLEQMDEFGRLDEYDDFYNWKSDNIVTDNGVCDLHEDEIE